VSEPTHHDDRAARAASFGRIAARAATASVLAATLLAGVKGYAAWATGSVAMLGSLADTGLDLLASAMTLFAVRLAAMPADHDHRFGHGKAEALAALFQVALIAASAVAIMARAANRLMAGAPTAQAEFGIGASLVAIVVTLALLEYQRRASRAAAGCRSRNGNQPRACARQLVRHGLGPRPGSYR